MTPPPSISGCGSWNRTPKFSTMFAPRIVSPFFLSRCLSSPATAHIPCPPLLRAAYPLTGRTSRSFCYGLHILAGSISPCGHVFYGPHPRCPGCALCYRLHTLSGQRPCATMFLRVGAYVLAAFPTGGASMQTDGILTGGINLTYCPTHPLTGRYCLLKQYRPVGGCVR